MILGFKVNSVGAHRRAIQTVSGFAGKEVLVRRTCAPGGALGRYVTYQYSDATAESIAAYRLGASLAKWREKRNV